MVGTIELRNPIREPLEKRDVFVHQDPPAAKKEDKEQESKDGEKKEEQKEESFWDSALKVNSLLIF